MPRSRALKIFHVTATVGDFLRDFLLTAALLLWVANVATNWYAVHHPAPPPAVIYTVVPDTIPQCPATDAMGVCERR